jgi:peptidyl-prolyl cis-trans isomerase D
VKSSFGYHILKLDGIRPAQVKPFEQVKTDVMAAIRDNKAVDKFYKLQSKLEKVAFESPDSLDEAAKAVQAKVHTTDFISLRDAPKILRSPKVQEALKNPEVKDEGLNSSVIEIAPEDVVVVRIEDARPKTVLPLKTVRDKVVAKLSRVKAEEQVSKIAEQALTALKQGDQSVLKANHLAFGELTLVDRSSPLARAVYAMRKPEGEHAVYGQTTNRNGDIVLVELIKTESKIDKQLTQRLAVQMDRLSRQQDISGLLGILREKTDIAYYLASQ